MKSGLAKGMVLAACGPDRCKSGTCLLARDSGARPGMPVNYVAALQPPVELSIAYCAAAYISYAADPRLQLKSFTQSCTAPRDLQLHLAIHSQARYAGNSGRQSCHDKLR